ncbi:MAG: hypothetical protein EBU46_00450 [Nitrosomonadaceae bacterium]|nr:hypothetical protein [Nitrosomonadaceae bacterium]
MPCRYEETPEEIAAAAKLAKEKTVGPLKKRIAALEKERDELTRLLCTTCTYIESLGHRSFFSNQEAVDTWWQEHKRRDAERAAKELVSRKPSKTLPLQLIRNNDGELFTLNSDGTTYSIEAMKQQFPKHLHAEFSLAALVNGGGFHIP